MKNSEILFCLLGSLILIFLSSSLINNILIRLPFGFIITEVLLVISSIGVLLIILFALILIKNNFKIYKIKEDKNES